MVDPTVLVRSRCSSAFRSTLWSSRSCTREFHWHHSHGCARLRSHGSARTAPLARLRSHGPARTALHCSTLLCTALHPLARLSMALHGSVRLCTAPYCSVLLGTARNCSALLGTARHCLAWLRLAPHGAAWLRTARLGSARLGLAPYCSAPLYTALHGSGAPRGSALLCSRSSTLLHSRSPAPPCSAFHTSSRGCACAARLPCSTCNARLHSSAPLSSHRS